MDGRTLAAGAVAAVYGYRHPIEIARKVMETTPHVMLVGAGAEMFAEANGFEPRRVAHSGSRGHLARAHPGRRADRLQPVRRQLPDQGR
jgi:isoaspartyl peptidase/L-asparaginase-like protein (Ntn-hydrolase superfamily)